ncbi:MAG TPA: peptidyl-prolyl cis-trans isomerase [Acidobacteriaceae bacterium]|jgi:peptidyl-prolyl cis-trans isomerase SurA|nr:peptidyl-prolyl cis-trans isomerase [Acidobacteriaceae bacterium]
MMLRVPLFPALLAASVGLTVVSTAVPAYAQGRASSDTQTQQSPYRGTVVEDIAARVNDQVISKSDYDRAAQELEGEARQQSWTQSQLMEQKRDLMRSLIDNQLLLSKGKELGINGETEVIKRLDDMRKQYHLASLEDLQKAAEAQGVSYEDLKEQIRENVIRSEVISQEVGSHIQVAPSEIRAYYQAHQAEFEKPEQERLSEILVPTPNPDDAAQVADAKKKADDIETRLKGGADFATVAKADSGGPTAAQGGDLGEFKREDLHSKELEDATFSLAAGQLTEPIRTRQGWLIMKVTEHQKGGVAPLEDVQNQVQEQIGMQKMEPALRDYLTRLRNEASIDVRAPYFDSGATPNEIKLVQSAYTPPQTKKKKKAMDRSRFRQKGVRQQKPEKETASVPAGVPTLDKVNGQKGKEVASNKGTEKPGKKEKIRFGQAPRETLPTGPTREVDAGATGAESSQGAQVAANQPENGVALTNAQGEVIDTSADNQTKKKTRLSDLAKQPKAKQRAMAQSKKRQKFAPPSETQQDTASDQLQQSALGLNGDSRKAAKQAKAEKKKAAKNAPKRRMSETDKKGDSNEQPNGTGTAQPGTPQGTGAAAPQF